jgi:hypothetical protein
MKHNILIATALCVAAAVSAGAQDTSSVRPKPPKDTSKITSTPGDVLLDTIPEWYVPMGKTCSTVDTTAAKAVTIKSELYSAGMISPDSAKIVALCAVPGQIGSGEMNKSGGRTVYEVDIIPNDKKTHTKVNVDAMTGAVLSSKQFGGLRGLAGWVRESAEHKMNKKPAADTAAKVKPPTDTTVKVKPPTL